MKSMSQKKAHVSGIDETTGLSPIAEHFGDSAMGFEKIVRNVDAMDFGDGEP